MAPKQTRPEAGSSKKRKASQNQTPREDDAASKRPKTQRRKQQRDVRTLATQTSSEALKNGEMNVAKFIEAREFEMRALDEGISRSKKALNLRAFQQVPKELRRRTASHNVKRVPKRLQRRAKREMRDDNTPTVTARRRKPSSHLRLRLETAKKLRVLGRKRKLAKEKAKEEAVVVTTPVGQKPQGSSGSPRQTTAITTRTPKIKKARLAEPPTPKAKFRKRQFDKTWLPTHLFHAKRAHMSPPKQPLWRFAVPLTPTVKSYRPTHRAVNERGALVWDTSYMSTLSMEGQERSLEGVLKALGVGSRCGNQEVWLKGGKKWRDGVRALEGFVFEREAPNTMIAPVTVMWAVPRPQTKGVDEVRADHRKRKIFLRVHPSAFQQLWEEAVRLSKTIRPQISIEDLRFEIGSIEISGPSATEALVSALWPTPSSDADDGHTKGGVETTWKSLAALTNLAMLPGNVLLGFDAQDPRLHHPPQTIKMPSQGSQQANLLELLAEWPADRAQQTPHLFDRACRHSAAVALPSQRSINRRKGLADPGQYPAASPKDPRIPVMLYSVASPTSQQSKWVVLLPWKCVPPVWYGIVYYPLATGGQARFGGLQEQRQLAFEAGSPWFPGDFPGTKAGWEWEMEERRKRKEAWQRLPKSKRVNWDAVELGDGRKGEPGLGWACDWQHILFSRQVSGVEGETKRREEQHTPKTNAPKHSNAPAAAHDDDGGGKKTPEQVPSVPLERPELVHITRLQARSLLQAKIAKDQAAIDLTRALIQVRITLVQRGVPQACARIYRLPKSEVLRNRWLSLQQQRPQKSGLDGLAVSDKGAPAHVVQQRLAQSLLEPARVGDARYPVCPGEAELIGFVTTGNFNLGEGRATGVGCIFLASVLDDARKDSTNGRWCVVRNAGSGVGRLARWELV